MARRPGGGTHFAARDNRSLAPSRLPCLLALALPRSRGLLGRPRAPKEARDLIREISLANPLWGAPRIHGEILKLGIDVAQSTVAKYMVKHRRPPWPPWRTFLTNHADGIAAIDHFVVPTIPFKLLFGFVVQHHDRRQLVVVAVTGASDGCVARRPAQRGFPRGTRHHSISSVIATAHMACHSRGAFAPWESATDRWRRAVPDRIPNAERVIGSIRREGLDHLIIFNEAHLTPRARRV